MMGGQFTLDDFLEQMNQLRKMGSMKKILGMLPGMGQYRQMIDDFDESSIKRIEAIIYSMTPAERRDPKILNGSRRQRIAAGSGTSVQEINALMEHFEQARKMMKQLSNGGGLPGMPGMPGMGMPGMGSASRKTKRKMQKKKSGNKKGRSGNPAKRARQQAEAATASSMSGASSAFGSLAAPTVPEDIDIEQLKRFLR